MKNKINIFTEELNNFKGIEKFKLKKDLIACNNDSKWLEKNSPQKHRALFLRPGVF